MPYNPALYMPQGYQPMYQPQMIQPPQQQAMTPPIRQAAIIQINSIGEEDQFQLQPGAPQMFMTADDLHIIIKTLGQNGSSKIFFDRRPPEPQEAPFDPKVYVRKDEIENIVAAILEGKETHHESV